MTNGVLCVKITPICIGLKNRSIHDVCSTLEDILKQLCDQDKKVVEILIKYENDGRIIYIENR